jgi:RNA polymerase sigma factor (sigma-70 family)
MATAQLTSIMRFLRRIVAAPGTGEPTDGQLLEGFIHRGEESAFAALMQRHGPMALGVCQRVLGDVHDAEDAFQATFLVLARKAGTVRKYESVGSWLYGVAYRIALKAKAAAARRRRAESEMVMIPRAEAPTDAAWRDLRPVLDEELNRLPEKYRAPVVLCYLEGKTNAEAAHHLGWTKGTVSGRLARARQQLRGRLTRRGITWSGGVLSATLLENGATAAVPPALATTTFKAALVAAAGKTAVAGAVSAQAAALAEGVIKTMFLTKLKMAMVVLMSVGLIGTGAGMLTYGAGAGPLADAASSAGVTAKVEGPDDNDQPESELAKLRKENERLRKRVAQIEEELRNVRRFLEASQAEADKARNEAIRRLNDAERARYAASIAEVEQKRAAEKDEKDVQNPIQQAANRAKSANNMKQLALAMHNYHDTNGRFPAAAIYSKDGKPVLSWRVALLPYLEQDNLFKQFRLDEPWDSEHNKKLLGIVPNVFAPPGIKTAKPFYTFYQVFAGKGTIFEGTEGAKIASITDGTSNTILIAEAGTPVPWTKPDDMPYADDKPLPKLGGIFGGNFHIAMADGSVRYVRKKINEKVLRLAITKDDGQVVDIGAIDK